jgi:hypothetical protein
VDTHQLIGGHPTIGYEPKVDYLFGFPTAIQTGGMVLDIPLSIVTAVNDGNAENKKRLVVDTHQLIIN